MICPNKNTKLYKKLEETFGKHDARRIAFKLMQPDFEVWYGKGERDANGDPVMKGTKITNEDGVEYPLERMIYSTEEKRQLWKEGELLGWTAPNGAPSNLSKAQWVLTRTSKFLEWFGDYINYPEMIRGYLDENGEPEEVEIDGAKVFARTKGQPFPATLVSAIPNEGEFYTGKRATKQSKLELTEADKQQNWLNNSAVLTRIFMSHGLDVEIIPDRSLEENANVTYIGNNKAIIKVNPDKVFKDTLPHEFSHLYIDLLGVNDPTIKKAIAQVKKNRPDLWQSIQAKYPELTEEELDKELIVTAMGIAGSVLHKKEGELSRWQFLINTIWRKIADIFNLPRDFAKDLYIDMAMKKWDAHANFANLQEGKTWKSVLNNIEKDNENIILDEDTHIYRDSEDPAVNFTSGTEFIKELSPRFKKGSTEKSAARIAAEKIFGSRPLDSTIKVKVGEEEREVTIEQLTNIQQIRYKTGMASGTVAHLLMERYIKKENGESVTEIDKKIDKVAAAKPDLQDEVDISWWDWLDDAMPTIYDKLNINILNPDVLESRRDKLKAELTLHSKTINVATKADTIIEHADSTITMIDWKGGKHFLDDVSDRTRFLEGGDGVYEYYDTKLNIARMEVMLRALLLKEQQRETKFRKLQVVHLDKLGVKHWDVNIKGSLKVLEKYFKKTNPKKYEELKEKGLFNAANYLATNTEFTQASAYEGMSPKEIIEDMQDELDRLVARPKKDREVNDRITELADQIIKAKAEKDVEFNLKDENDINWVKRWLGNKYTVKNKYIQSWFKDFLDPAVKDMRDEIENIQQEHKKVLVALLQEYYGSKGKNYSASYVEAEINKIGAAVGGLAGLAIGGGVGAAAGATILGHLGKNYAMAINTEELYEFMYDRNEDVLKKGLYLKTDTSKMSPAQLAYYTFWKNTIHTEYSKTMSKRVYVADLDEYKSLAEILDKPTELNDDFLPRVPITMEEIKERDGFKGASKEYLKRQAREYAKIFNQDVTTFNEKHTHGVHLKYMGSKQIISEGNHTMNAELMFNKFIHNIVAKRHLDTPYAVGEGIKNLLHLKENGKEFKNTISFLEDQMQIHILGRDRKEIDKGFKIRIPKIVKGKVVPNQFWFIDVGRLMIAFKNFTSAITMWLKPVGGFMNTMLITAQNIKEATKGSLVKRFGVEGDEAEFTLSTLTKSQKMIAQYWADSFAGKVADNKLHIMLKQWDFLPSNFDYVTSQNKLYSGKQAWFNESNFFVFHGLGEEWGQMTLLVAMLLSKKHNGVSYWDNYEVENGKLVWKGGTRFERADAAGTTKIVTGLEPEEITRMKRVTARIHGGYRHEEKVALELTALGKWLLQFKKYLPSVIENAITGKYDDVSLGGWKKREGEDIYDWVARTNEGRIQLMGKYIAATLSQKFGSGQIFTDYTWEELGEEQRKNILDFYVSWGYWTAATAGLWAGFDDDDDPWRQRFEMKVQDLTQSWNPLDTGRAIKEPTVVIPRIYKIIDSFADFLLKGVIQGRVIKSGPNKGRMYGITNVRKGLPFVSTDEEMFRFGLLEPVVQR